MKGVRSVSRIFFSHLDIVPTYLLKILSFLHGIAFASLSKITILVSIYCSFIVSLEVAVIVQLFSLNTVLAILDLLLC